MSKGGLGIAPWDGGESALEFRRLGRGQGCKDPWRASFPSSLLIALSPHTVDYCSSYELLNRWWHGHSLATQWPGLFIMLV
uniref:Hepatocellular carcinoma, down-regulated 1 n=1 Tax=Aotus nancymaae TaxID=37293 RepID=A0A2K5DR50_AOTNA